LTAIASKTTASLALCIANGGSRADTAAIEAGTAATSTVGVAQARACDELQTLAIADVCITGRIRRELWAWKGVSNSCH
jgi:hypothetical protein